MASLILKAGDLRHKVEIQEPTTTLDGMGAFDNAWSTLTRRFVKIENLSGRELVEAQQVDARANVRITMRYFKDLLPKHRIVKGCRELNVVHINNVDERNKFQIVLCGEDVD